MTIQVGLQRMILMMRMMDFLILHCERDGEMEIVGEIEDRVCEKSECAWERESVCEGERALERV